MLFNSIQFLVFFQALLGVYFIIPHIHRWKLLLAASIYFYMCWNPYYIILLLFSVSIDFVAAISIEKLTRIAARKLLLGLSLSCNLGILFYFKYYNFFLTGVNIAAGTKFSLLQIILPVGISFYTFQSMSYTIDVYRRQIPAQKNYGKFLLFVTFFPQLVAGPIERANHLMPQLFYKQSFDLNRIGKGYCKILWGLFLKMVIADRAGEYVNTIYAHTSAYNGLQVLAAVLLFTIQIYCDFMGYSTIAVGTAQALGIDLMQNFRQPYFAASIIDFWRRWHISLSTWFKDYVYVPLGGNKVSRLARSRNLLITFVLSGIWHGAKFTMFIWGTYHGILVAVQSFFQSKNKTASQKSRVLLPGIIITFMLVALGLAIFRSNDVNQMLLVFNKLIQFNSYTTRSLNLFEQPFDAYILLGGILFLLFADFSENRTNIFWMSTLSFAQRAVAVVLLITMIILFGKFESVDFIYFQF